MYFVTFWCRKCQTGSVVTVQSQSEHGTIKIKFLVFCLRAIKTCFFNLFFSLFIFVRSFLGGKKKRNKKIKQIQQDKKLILKLVMLFITKIISEKVH
jgi:NADH:ubiquinone oxidoreductase subunit 5 (subunit L)/multisubunit Na+/H+ antiporter MnhA subunit